MLVIVVLAVPIGNVRADKNEEATEVFNQLYGDSIRKAKSTRERTDDLELASQLLSATSQAGESTTLIRLMCENAYALAFKYPEGEKTAIDAMQLLARKIPDQALACQLRIVEVRDRWYRLANSTLRTAKGQTFIESLAAAFDMAMGKGDYDQAVRLQQRIVKTARTIRLPEADGLNQRLQQTKHRAMIQRQIATHTDRLKTSPNDRTSHAKLMMLYLIDLNDPQHALRHVVGATNQDDPIRTLLPLATGSIQVIDEDRCRKLGDWYRRLAINAGQFSKPSMLDRALRYYERYLELHATRDVHRIQVSIQAMELRKKRGMFARTEDNPTVMVKPVEKPKPPETVVDTSSGWIDLLRHIDPTADAIKGQWKMTHTGLRCEPIAFGRIVAPIMLRGGYHLQVKFVRIQGTDSVNLILPTGLKRSMLVLGGWPNRGPYSGLHLIDGRGADNNPTTTQEFNIKSGHEYLLDLKVTLDKHDAKVEVDIDGKRLIRWSGAQDVMSVLNDWTLPNDGYLALGAWHSVVEFRQARVRMIDGKAQGGRDIVPISHKATFTAPNQANHLTPLSHDDGPFVRTTVDGKSVIQAEGHYLYFDIDDTFLNDLSPDEDNWIMLQVTVFDDAKRMLHIQYDSNYAPSHGKHDGRWTAGTWRTMQDTREWRTFTYILPYAKFANRQQGKFDFRLIGGNSPLRLHRAVVFKHDPKEIGGRSENIFDFGNDRPDSKTTARPDESKSVDLLKLIKVGSEHMKGRWRKENTFCYRRKKTARGSTFPSTLQGNTGSPWSQNPSHECIH